MNLYRHQRRQMTEETTTDSFIIIIVIVECLHRHFAPLVTLQIHFKTILNGIIKAP